MTFYDHLTLTALMIDLRRNNRLTVMNNDFDKAICQFDLLKPLQLLSYLLCGARKQNKSEERVVGHCIGFVCL